MFLTTALLLASLAIPMVRRRVGPNHWYGVRTRATYTDEWVWYEANARSGRDLLLFALALASLAILLALLDLPLAVYDLALSGFLFVGALVLAWVGIVRANRLLRERER